MWDQDVGWWIFAATGNEFLGAVHDLSIPGDDLAIPAGDVGLHVPARGSRYLCSGTNRRFSVELSAATSRHSFCHGVAIAGGPR